MCTILQACQLLYSPTHWGSWFLCGIANAWFRKLKKRVHLGEPTTSLKPYGLTRKGWSEGCLTSGESVSDYSVRMPSRGGLALQMARTALPYWCWWHPYFVRFSWLTWNQGSAISLDWLPNISEPTRWLQPRALVLTLCWKQFHHNRVVRKMSPLEAISDYFERCLKMPNLGHADAFGSTCCDTLLVLTLKRRNN